MDDDTKRIRDLARSYGEQAIENLAEIMVTGEKEAARVVAARALLERGFGAPERKSTTDVNVAVFDARTAHLEALKKLVSPLRVLPGRVIEGSAEEISEAPSTLRSKFEE